MESETNGKLAMLIIGNLKPYRRVGEDPIIIRFVEGTSVDGN